MGDLLESVAALGMKTGASESGPVISAEAIVLVRSSPVWPLEQHCHRCLGTC